MRASPAGRTTFPESAFQSVTVSESVTRIGVAILPIASWTASEGADAIVRVTAWSMQALTLWERRERRRLEIIAMIEEADASLARGEGRVFTKETTPALIAEHKERLRRRIAAAEKPTGGR